MNKSHVRHVFLHVVLHDGPHLAASQAVDVAELLGERGRIVAGADFDLAVMAVGHPHVDVEKHPPGHVEKAVGGAVLVEARAGGRAEGTLRGR